MSNQTNYQLAINVSCIVPRGNWLDQHAIYAYLSCFLSGHLEHNLICPQSFASSRSVPPLYRILENRDNLKNTRRLNGGKHWKSFNFLSKLHGLGQCFLALNWPPRDAEAYEWSHDPSGVHRKKKLTHVKFPINFTILLSFALYFDSAGGQGCR